MSSSKGKAPAPPAPITYDPLAAKDGDDSDASDPEEETKKEKKFADMAYHPMSPVDLEKLDPKLEFLELTHNRLTSVPTVISKMSKLESLVMRRNLIKAITQLEDLTKLEHLDLQDNLIQTAAGVVTLTNLEELDLSYNGIRRVADPSTKASLIPAAPKLKNLYLNSNKIRETGTTGHSALPALATLHTLELGDNRIRDIDGIFHLTTISKLFYGKNKIASIPNMAPLINLTVLSLQSNRVTQITGLSGCVNLRELYLSHNGLKSIGEGLVGLNQLEILDVAGNFLTSLSAAEVGHLESLEDFWANDNKISGWNQLDALVPLKNLTTVYFERNPALWADEDYVDKIRAKLPKIEQIDAIRVDDPAIRRRRA